MATTWNPSDKSAQINLTNGNLTATGNGVYGGAVGVRSSTSKLTGKVYFEVAVSVTQSQSVVCVATGSADMTTLYDTNLVAAAGIIISSAWFYVNGSGVLQIEASQVNIPSTVCIALDLTNSRMWMRAVGASNVGNWNGSGTANPATNVGGVNVATLFPTNPAFAEVSSWAAQSAVRTANFGATAFVGTVPSGFTAWDAPAETVTTPSSRPGGMAGGGGRAWAIWAAEQKATRKAARKALGLPDEDEDEDEEENALDKFLKDRESRDVRLGSKSYRKAWWE